MERINDTCFVIPDNTGIKADFYVPEARSMSAKHKDKVVVELADWKQKIENPIGHITEILGNAGSNDVEMKSILVENGFFTAFPQKVLEEAENLEFGSIRRRKEKTQRLLKNTNVYNRSGLMQRF